MEIWDGYRIDGQLAGCDLIRGEPIPKGLYHIVCEVLVLHRDGAYLLMQRDFNKLGYPGMFETSAGGSALKGESPFQAAYRELKEETGITAHELTLINKTHADSTLYYSYLCITDCDKTSITLQEGETISYRWISKEDFLKFIHSPQCILPQKDRFAPYWQNL